MRTIRLTPPAAGLLIGLTTGIADAVIVVARPAWARLIAQPEEPFTWVAVIWTWMTVCCLAGALVHSPRLGRLRAIPLVAAGPGLLLLSRAATWMKETTGLSTAGTLVAIGVVTLVLAAGVALIPLADSPRVRTYFFASILSAVAIALCGAHLPPRIPHARALQPSRQRNVLLIFLDTVRADGLPQMPRLGAFSKTAISFENAWAPAPWTIPSHFAVLSGAEPRAGRDQLKRGFYRHSAPLLWQRLHARGYETGAIFANYLLSTTGGFGEGFDQYLRTRQSRVCASGLGNLAFRSWLHDAPRVPWCASYSASEVTGHAQRFIARAKRPYLLVVNYFDAHDPYYVEPHCRGTQFQPVTRSERNHVIEAAPANPPDPRIASRVYAQYRATLQCLDGSLGALLEVAGRDPNTVIAIVGDHGEQFGEHGFGWHGNSVYRQLLHVPLILKAPGLRSGSITDVVSITDLHRTLLTLADPAQGGTLPLLNPKLRRAAVATFANESGAAVSVTRGPHHFIRWMNGREELYDYVADPEERHPLSPETLAGPLREIALEATPAHASAVDFRALGYLH